MASSKGESSVVANSKFEVDSKYRGLESNVWIELNSLNDDLGNCVNLGQGFPDFNPAPQIVAQLHKVSDPKNPDLYAFHQYARAYGHTRLVKALAKLYSRLMSSAGFKIDINPMTEVLVTGGAYGALFYTIMSNVGEGDEVIIIEPFFDCYPMMVRLAGGTPVFIALEPREQSSTTSNKNNFPSSESWALDMTQFAKLFNSKTKAIILNSPNNPLGKIFSLKELTEIGDLCKKWNVLVISDEVYEWLVYGSNEHYRICTLPGMWERTITIGSAGKTFSLTGWKLGWAYGPENLIRNLQIAHQNCTYMCQTPEQEAVAAALEIEIENLGTTKSYFHKLREDLTQKRDFMINALREADAGLIPVVPQGGYFLLTNWRLFSESTQWKSIATDPSGETETDDFRFVKWLARKKQLLGIPPSAFYDAQHKYLAKHYIRFNFYKKSETLEKAKEILGRLNSP